MLLLLSCFNGPVTHIEIFRHALVVDDRGGAAPSDELDPVEATLEDPDAGRVSAGKAQGGRGVKEGEKSLDEFGNLLPRFVWTSSEKPGKFVLLVTIF